MVPVLVALAVFALPVAALESVTIPRGGQSGWGRSGTAVLTALGNQTRVVATRSNPPAGAAQPARIHEETCASSNPKPRYPLQSLVDGRPETVVDVPLAELLAGQFAIDVNEAQQRVNTSVACGEIGPRVTPATGAGPRTLPGWLIAAALLSGFISVATGFGLRLARREKGFGDASCLVDRRRARGTLGHRLWWAREQRNHVQWGRRLGVRRPRRRWLAVSHGHADPCRCWFTERTASSQPGARSSCADGDLDYCGG